MPSPVANLAVVRFTPAQEGILWTHEFGHNCGLSHRTNNGNAVMFPSIAAESTAYLSGPSALVGAAGVAAAHDVEGFQSPKDAREFVRQHFFDGIPYEAAASYTTEDADVLLKMLANPKEDEEFLPEIVTTLCFIGSEKAVQPLIEFFKGPLSSEAAFKAKNATLIHLGDLINKTDSKLAVEFLTSVANKPVEARALSAARVQVAAVAAAEVTAPTAEELASELAVSATWGLALAGKAEAEAVINGLGASPTAMESVKELAVEAAKTSKAVRKMGLKGYYDEKKKHNHPKE